MSLIIGNTTAGNATGPSVNINHNNDGNLLLVGIHYTGADPSVISYGGVSMKGVVGGGGGFTTILLYALTNPLLGVNSIFIAGPNQRYDIAAISIKGAFQVLGSPYNATNLTGSPPVINLTPNTDITDIAIAFLRTSNPSIQSVTVTAGTSQITGEIGVATITASSPTSTITWQGGGSYGASAVAVAIRQFRSGAFLLNLI